MTQLVCPSCGKLTPCDRYDPSAYDHDILGVEVYGKGRGKGFEVSEKFSLLDDEELMSKIKERNLEITEILIENGNLTIDELRERFPGESDGEYTREDWKNYANSLNRRIRAVVDDVGDALGRDLEDEGENSIERLEAGAELLIDGYNAHKAAEEEDETFG